MMRFLKELSNKDDEMGRDKRSSGQRRSRSVAEPRPSQDYQGYEGDYNAGYYCHEEVPQGQAPGQPGTAAQYPTGQVYYDESPHFQKHVYATAVSGGYGEEARYEVHQNQSASRRESKKEDRSHSRSHSQTPPADEEDDRAYHSGYAECADYPSPPEAAPYGEPQTYEAGPEPFYANLGPDPVAGLNSGKPTMRRGAYRRDSDLYSIDDVPGSRRPSGIDPYHGEEQINLLPRAHDEPAGLPVPGRRNAVPYIPQPPVAGTEFDTGYADTGYGYDPTRRVAPYSGGTDPRDFASAQRREQPREPARHSRRHSMAGPPPARS